MPTAVEINSLRMKNGLPLLRFDLRKLSEQDLLDLRHAFEALYEISKLAMSDKRGYQALARGHGFDQNLCHSDDRLFLAWHRTYVYVFEKALTSALQWKRKDPSLVITLPYWDWTVTDPATDTADGIPRSCDDELYLDPTAGGAEKPNPLRRAWSAYRVESQGLSGAAALTDRYPTGFSKAIPGLASAVKKALLEPDFATFNTTTGLENPHNTVHLRAGGINPNSALPGNVGDLRAVVSAAFDPLFWLHHCFIDKLWFEWQAKHGDATVGEHVRGATLYGGLTGETALQSEAKLKVGYAVTPAGAGAAGLLVDASPDEAPLPPTLRAVVGNVGAGVATARLELVGLKPPRSSYEVRVFVNEPGASQTTETDGNPRYAGTLALFGHGRCHGAPGHCNPNLEARGAYDLRPGHHFARRTFALDVTDAIRAVVGHGGEVELSFVVIDGAGNQVAPEEIDVDGVALVTR